MGYVQAIEAEQAAARCRQMRFGAAMGAPTRTGSVGEALSNGFAAAGSC
jgi:hypothetical protein